VQCSKGSKKIHFFTTLIFNSASCWWNTGTLTLRPPTKRPHDIPTHTICPPNILSTVTIFYCDTATMWHFATVTFRLCDNFLLWHSVSKWTGLSVHPKKWMFCHTVTFRPTVILANPWLWHFVHFGLIQVKKGGRPITVTKRPTFRGGVDVSYLDVSNGWWNVAVVKCHWVHLSQ
jgi:hypothetical protein